MKSSKKQTVGEEVLGELVPVGDAEELFNNDEIKQETEEMVSKSTEIAVDPLLTGSDCDQGNGAASEENEDLEFHESGSNQMKSRRLLRNNFSKKTNEIIQSEHCDDKVINFAKLKKPKHTNEMLQCRHCDYRPNHPGNLKSHSRKHTGKMVQCQQCDYKSDHSGNLKKHFRKHFGEMFQCQHCDYKNDNSVNLKNHTRHHTGEKVPCEQCDFKTSYTSSLKAHSRKHTGELFP